MNNKKNNIIKSEYLSILPGMMLTSLATTACVLLNGLIVGNFLGSVELVAIGLSAPIVRAITALSGMFSVGTTEECTKAIAVCNREKANSVFTTSVVFSFFIGLLLMCVSLIIPKTIASLLGAKDELVKSTALYLQGFSFCLLPSIINQTLASFIYMCNKPRKAIYASIIKLLVNLLVDYYFIIYLHKGVFYAGIATSIGALAEMAFLLSAFISEKSIVSIKLKLFRIKEFVNVIMLGFKTFLIHIIIAFRNVIFNYFLINTGGADAVSAWAVMCNSVVFLDALSEGSILAITTLFNISAGENDKASMKEIWKILFTRGIMFMALIGSIYVIFSSQIGGLFGLEQRAQRFVQFFVIAYAFVIIFDNLCDTMLSIWQILGEIKMAIWVSILSYGVLPILSCLALYKYIGCYCVICGMGVAYACGILEIFVISWIKNKKFTKTLKI